MILASSQTASVGWHKAQHKHLPVKAVAVPTIMQMKLDHGWRSFHVLFGREC